MIGHFAFKIAPLPPLPPTFPCSSVMINPSPLSSPLAFATIFLNFSSTTFASGAFATRFRFRWIKSLVFSSNGYCSFATPAYPRSKSLIAISYVFASSTSFPPSRTIAFSKLFSSFSFPSLTSAVTIGPISHSNTSWNFCVISFAFTSVPFWLRVTIDRTSRWFSRAMPDISTCVVVLFVLREKVKRF